MSAFKETGALLSIGGAILHVIGLNPQRLTMSAEARFPKHAIPGGLHIQKTGLGPRTLMIEAKTFPHITGGKDAYMILEAIFGTQATVPYIRLAGNFRGERQGACVIETLETDEEKLHPFDGVGREIEVSIGLLMMPRGAFYTGGGSRQTQLTNIGAPRR